MLPLSVLNKILYYSRRGINIEGSPMGSAIRSKLAQAVKGERVLTVRLTDTWDDNSIGTVFPSEERLELRLKTRPREQAVIARLASFSEFYYYERAEWQLYRTLYPLDEKVLMEMKNRWKASYRELRNPDNIRIAF